MHSIDRWFKITVGNEADNKAIVDAVNEYFVK